MNTASQKSEGTPRPLHSSLLLIFLVALAARAPIVWGLAPDFSRLLDYSDSQQYFGLAQNVEAIGVYTLSTAPPYLPEVWRTPGYPLFLALLIRIGGPEPLWLVVATQALIGATTACGVSALATLLSGARAGVWAGGIYALAPMPVVMVGYMYAEVLFSAALIVSLLVLIAGLRRCRIALTGMAGAVYGLSILIRPIGMPVLFLLAAVPFLGLPFKAAWKHSAAFLVAGLVFLSPWLIRSYRNYGRLGLTSISDNNLYYYNAASLHAYLTGLTFDEAQAELADRLERTPLPEDRWPTAREGILARQIILAHPFAFAWRNGLDAANGLRPGFSYMLSLFPPASPVRNPIEIFRSGTPGEILSVLWRQPLMILVMQAYMAIFVGVLAATSAIGCIALTAQRQWLELTLLAAVPAAFLYLPGIAGNARFRMPVEGLLIVLGVLGIQWVTRMMEKKKPFCCICVRSPAGDGGLSG